MSEIQTVDLTEVPEDCSISIIIGRYNDHIGSRLLQGCMSTLAEKGIGDESTSIIYVPGAFEMPVTAARLARLGKADAIITLGAVIRGDTPHFNFVASECASGLSRVAIDFDLPVIFGVLTVDNEEQAQARSGDNCNNKGSEVALTALEMISILRKISE